MAGLVVFRSADARLEVPNTLTKYATLMQAWNLNR